MPVLGIGVDILHVPRIAAVLKRTYGSRLPRRILSPSEHVQWDALNDSGASSEAQLKFLAVRWCVKEAAYKAIYPHAIPQWKELTYTSLAAGVKPQLEYTPLDSKQKGRFDHIHVSVSHDGEYVLSQVLVEGRSSLFLSKLY
ncbi:4'-phosphopantetheinyl transferase [Ephemerocybe angulata]|uniref:4'-phosphopantetheinyl transferase n=1 Tax=Ephemerocybe angulata TaxID=980116 RepID=A0A8H6MFT8_9AGAR|nr:4'-phosphopantetheinyl transferase [Tulosesus angulatus]